MYDHANISVTKDTRDKIKLLAIKEKKSIKLLITELINKYIEVMNEKKK